MTKPIATPATGALIGTPASIIARSRRRPTPSKRSRSIEDVGDDADRVREIGFGRHHRRERALGQSAMADLATAGAAHRLDFADRKRREVVVQHEALPHFAVDHFDLLLVVVGAERDGDERLRLTAREEREPWTRGRTLTSSRSGGSRRTCGRPGECPCRGSIRAAPFPAGRGTGPWPRPCGRRTLRAASRSGPSRRLATVP